jgi:hypothetical protein
METIYANFIQIRMTPTELVLEFGNYFPDRPGLGVPSDYKPDTRVVMNIGNLGALAQGLQQAIRTRQTQAVTPEPKFETGGVGFVPPTGSDAR